MLRILVTRKVDVMDAMVHKWREQSKMKMLTHGIHNPVKQRSPNNLLSVSYRWVQMSISHGVGHLAEPLCANVVSCLPEGDLHGAGKGSMCGGARGHPGGAVLLPRSYPRFCYPCLHLTCPELQHLGQQLQAPLHVSI